jgi:hypothetical protein
MASPDLPAVYARLRPLLERHAGELRVTADGEQDYSLDAMGGKKPLFFGAVQVKKNYVSYHLMPVYVHPDMLEGVSERLRKRMQGKSCFNFTAIDDDMIAELDSLTRQGLERYRQDGVLAE